MAGTDQHDEHDGPPRTIFIAALVVAVGAIAAIIGVAALRTPPREPVAISSVPAPKATDPACAALLTALPAQLGDYQRATAAEPVPPGAAAWQAESGSEPVILRCGLDRPADFVVGTPLQVVDQVQWFHIGEPGTGDDRSTWYAVDRPVYVALTLPAGSGPTPIQEISEKLAAVMPATAIRPGPPG